MSVTNFDYASYVSMMSQFGHSKVLKPYDSMLECIASKAEFTKEMTRLKNLDIVGRVLKDLYDDSFPSSSFLFEYYYESGSESTDKAYGQKINNLLASMVEKVQLKKFISENINTLMLNGDFYSSYVTRPQEGVVEILDNINQEASVCIYQSTASPAFLLEQGATSINVIPTRDKAIFSLGPTRIKFRVDDWDTLPGKVKRKVPEYILSGRPLFFYALDKLKTLKILQAKRYIQELRDALTPDIITVGVPSDTDPTNVSSIIKEYTNHLRKQPFVPGMEITLEQLAYAMSEPKVLPSFSDSKGVLNKPMNNDNSNETESTKEDNIKKDIAIATGYPLAYLDESAQNRVSTIKANGRYAKLIKSVHYAIDEPLRKIGLSHLNAFGMQIKPHNLKVRFKDTVDIDALDNLEYSAVGIEFLNTVLSAMTTIASNEEQFGLKLNPTALKKYIDDSLGTVAKNESIVNIK